MKIKWIGHACFLIEGEAVRILTDPYDESIPYRPPDFPVDVITVSHEHSDHNAVHRVSGNPVIVRGEGPHQASGISLRGIASFHDDEKGQKRGKNTIFVFEIEGIHLAHLGDLGAPLTDDQARGLADVEVLFIPVGGYFTIGPEQAQALTEKLSNLKVVIPMHYKTDRLGQDFPIVSVDKFVAKMQNVKHIRSSEVILTRDTLPRAQEVWILDYA
jgi:L-ascorbate metabolism protein UlaG (beta-lactamase superfamily)